jgi:hypothetical protein
MQNSANSNVRTPTEPVEVPPGTKQQRTRKSKKERHTAAKRAAGQREHEAKKKAPQSRTITARAEIANRPVRSKNPVVFADGITMSIPKAKTRGNRLVANMMRDVKAFNHGQAKAAKAVKAASKTLQKERVLNFKTALTSPEHTHWEQANYEEFQRFKVTETLAYVKKSQIPAGRKIAYYNPQIKVKASNGILTYRVRGTIGGDKVDYPGLVAANTADMKTIKLLLNSTVSTPGAKFMTLDIKDFYLGTILPRKEYMRISAKQVSQKFIDENNLQSMCEDGYYYVEIAKGIYGLPQAGLLAQEKLIQLLKSKGYHMAPNTPCLFKHETRSIMFSLVVDDFGVKYTDKADAQHLIDTLQEAYKLHIDWTGADYVGLTLDWNYDQCSVAVSMPGYVQKALERFCADQGKGANSPMVYIPPRYGEKIQYAKDEQEPAATDAESTKRIQQIVGVFLYYARAVDYSILTAITTISTRQSKITTQVQESVDRLLAYVRKYPDTKIIFRASKMQLVTHADASYLCESGARSRAGGIMWLGDASEPTQVNGAITCISKIIDAVVASAGEAEYAGLFMLAQEAEVLRTTLQEMGHEQPPTTIFCDNACAVGISNDTIKQKRSKAIDMRFHWIRDRVRIGHFVVKWIKGVDNLADFFTKALPIQQHQKIKKIIVHSPENTEKANAMRIMWRARNLMK